MKHPRAQEGKACPPKHHALDELQFVYLPFNDTIVVMQGETSEDSCFVSLDCKCKLSTGEICLIILVRVAK